MLIAVGVTPPNRLPTEFSLPSVVKVTLPELIRPLVLLSRSPGLARSSANHSLGPGPFSSDRVTVRWPPLESETGIWISKSGLTPVVGSSA
jgi:hypothetical protein